MHLILTGATGTCGSAVLRHCLADTRISRLTVLSRRPVALADGDKVTVIIQDDFTQYPQALLDQLRGAEGCIWALGISQTRVTRDEYIKITYDYAMAAATAFATLSDPFKFVFVSGEGADPTERSFTLFGKIKGRVEKDLHALSTSLPSLRTFAVRPALIDPEREILSSTTPRTTIEAVTLTALAPIFRLVGKGLIIGTKPLARALTELAVGDGAALPEAKDVEAHGRTLRNTAVRRLAGV